MELVQEFLGGVKVHRPFIFEDERGRFVKPFHEGQLAEMGIQMTIREEFYSTSKKGVLRGMHFQTPPHAHNKLIYCTRGRVLDVFLDLRKESPTYGQAESVELTAENGLSVFIPIGFGHGFLSLEDDSCLIYKTDAVYAPDNDTGVRFDSFDFEWPVVDPLLSSRDKSFPAVSNFHSPF